ncbi:MAG TPA: glycosyltransferase, partial [Opitutales bacterium]|nr:glycosyltransferase [Opitutales bacterium]
MKEADQTQDMGSATGHEQAPGCGLVSVVTRTRNRPVFLARAVESLLSQTYPDWEHIIVNDGGDAAALDSLLLPYAERYAGRLKLVHLARNEGMQAASNAGLALASGEFVAIHDDDDSWHPDFLSACVAFLREKGPESPYQGVVTHTVRVLEDIDSAGRIAEVSRAPYQPMDEISLFRVGFENPFPPIAFVYRRAAHRVIGNFDPKFSYAADLDFNLRFLARWEIGVIGRPLAYYHWRRFSPDSTLHNTVTAEASVHGRLLNEWLNDALRRDAGGDSGRLGLAMNLSRYAVGTRAALDGLSSQISSHAERLGDLQSRLEGVGETLSGDALPRLADLKAHLDSISNALSGDALVRLGDLKEHLGSLSAALEGVAGTQGSAAARVESLIAGLQGALAELSAAAFAHDGDLKAHLDSISNALSGDALVRLGDLKEHLGSLSMALEGVAGTQGSAAARVESLIAGLQGTLAELSAAAFAHDGDLKGRLDALAAEVQRIPVVLSAMQHDISDNDARLCRVVELIQSETLPKLAHLESHLAGVDARISAQSEALTGLRGEQAVAAATLGAM